MSLDICEIFCSLQGESTYAGLACVFVRLSGCNLDCAWCDTPYAREEAVSMSLDEIMGQVASFNCRLVEITGGEPLIQAQTPELVSRLVKRGIPYSWRPTAARASMGWIRPVSGFWTSSALPAKRPAVSLKTTWPT